MRILVVEDDRNTNQVICEFLKASGYEVLPAYDGEEALALFYENRIALVIADIMLPKKNGLEVLNYIRSLSQTPVIMLTALGDDYTQIRSFDLQADDYITKPFSPTILVKRVQAVLKRTAAPANEPVALGDVLLDFSAYRVTRNGVPIAVTAKELEILKFLIENRGRVVSRQQILDHVWGLDAASSDRTIDTHIKNIRKKLNCGCIMTVKGIGYKMEMDLCEKKD